MRCAFLWREENNNKRKKNMTYTLYFSLKKVSWVALMKTTLISGLEWWVIESYCLLVKFTFFKKNQSMKFIKMIKFKENQTIFKLYINIMLSRINNSFYRKKRINNSFLFKWCINVFYSKLNFRIVWFERISFHQFGNV